ncbi:MAG: YidC/Oxa1 family insertase periplasmic-domain containing protein [Candidatus Omnitrophica bacterium]|nr:YidC/Oxa1 family insertase periplasmic-domain containing protein [Candidatus Omnitrophota bacterium]
MNTTVAQELKTNKNEEKIEPLVPAQEADLPKIQIGNFIVTYSERGGYITKIALLKYGEDLPFRNIGFIPEEGTKNFSSSIVDNKIIFTAANGGKKEFIFEGYVLKVNSSSLPQHPIVLFSDALSSNMLEQGYQEFFFARENDIQRKNFKKIKDETIDGLQFTGSRNQYFCISLLPGQYNIKAKKSKAEVDILLVPSSAQFSLYIGPQIAKELKPFGLEGVINYGFFHSIGVILVWFLHLFYSWTKNWGISIILMTTLVYIVLFPFTMQSTKAMKKMALIQPELDKLKAQYKDNLPKLQKEQAELFKKYKINPLGGCLPFVFQMPVFFALLQVFLRFVEVKGVSFLWIKDLTLPDRLFKFPVNIPFVGDYLNILPLLMVALTLIQQKVTTPSTNKEQKSMALFFAVFMGVMFYNFSACLALYWFIQNLLTFAYQWKVSRVKQNYSPA